MKRQKIQNSQHNIKKTKLEDYLTSSLTTILYWQNNRHIDQWNIIQSPEIQPKNIVNLSLTNAMQGEKGSFFNK